MSQNKGRPEVIFLGRYNESEILTGPEKVAKRIFAEFTKEKKGLFIEYFFDRRKYGIIKKLFGKEKVTMVNGSLVLRLGLIYLLYFLLKHNVKIVHVVTFERFTVIAVMIGFLKNYKIIYNVHGIIRYELKHFQNVSPFFYFRNSFCEKILFKYSNKLFFLSENSIHLAERYYKIKKSKLELIPNGIDPEFHDPGRLVRKPKNDQLKFVFIGNIKRKEKGFNTVLSILNKIEKNICLYVISNERMETVENRKHKIIFQDFLNTGKLAEFFSDKDLFISFPLYEPFSIACVEAMAAGLIPVISEKVGMSRYIENDHNGFIIDENDSVRLNQIVELLTNVEKRIQMSFNATTIYNELSWDDVYRKYDSIYNKITG